VMTARSSPPAPSVRCTTWNSTWRRSKSRGSEPGWQPLVSTTP
jgi:hypothetical protein